jgi:hypothetical protein
MARHGFGKGEYQYFSYPLPGPSSGCAQSLYPPLAWVANHWAARLGEERRFPETLDGCWPAAARRARCGRRRCC